MQRNSQGSGPDAQTPPSKKTKLTSWREKRKNRYHNLEFGLNKPLGPSSAKNKQPIDSTITPLDHNEGAQIIGTQTNSTTNSLQTNNITNSPLNTSSSPQASSLPLLSSTLSLNRPSILTLPQPMPSSPLLDSSLAPPPLTIPQLVQPMVPTMHPTSSMLLSSLHTPPSLPLTHHHSPPSFPAPQPYSPPFKPLPQVHPYLPPEPPHLPLSSLSTQHHSQPLFPLSQARSIIHPSPNTPPSTPLYGIYPSQPLPNTPPSMPLLQPQSPSSEPLPPPPLPLFKDVWLGYLAQLKGMFHTCRRNCFNAWAKPYKKLLWRGLTRYGCKKCVKTHPIHVCSNACPHSNKHNIPDQANYYHGRGYTSEEYDIEPFVKKGDYLRFIQGYFIVHLKLVYEKMVVESREEGRPPFPEFFRVVTRTNVEDKNILAHLSEERLEKSMDMLERLNPTLSEAQIGLISETLPHDMNQKMLVDFIREMLGVSFSDKAIIKMIRRSGISLDDSGKVDQELVLSDKKHAHERAWFYIHQYDLLMKGALMGFQDETWLHRGFNATREIFVYKGKPLGKDHSPSHDTSGERIAISQTIFDTVGIHRQQTNKELYSSLFSMGTLRTHINGCVFMPASGVATSNPQHVTTSSRETSQNALSDDHFNIPIGRYDTCTRAKAFAWLVYRYLHIYAAFGMVASDDVMLMVMCQAHFSSTAHIPHRTGSDRQFGLLPYLLSQVAWLEPNSRDFLSSVEEFKNASSSYEDEFAGMFHGLELPILIDPIATEGNKTIRMVPLSSMSMKSLIGGDITNLDNIEEISQEIIRQHTNVKVVYVKMIIDSGCRLFSSCNDVSHWVSPHYKIIANTSFGGDDSSPQILIYSLPSPWRNDVTNVNTLWFAQVFDHNSKRASLFLDSTDAAVVLENIVPTPKDVIDSFITKLKIKTNFVVSGCRSSGKKSEVVPHIPDSNYLPVDTVIPLPLEVNLEEDEKYPYSKYFEPRDREQLDIVTAQKNADVFHSLMRLRSNIINSLVFKEVPEDRLEEWLLCASMTSCLKPGHDLTPRHFTQDEQGVNYHTQHDTESHLDIMFKVIMDAIISSYYYNRKHIGLIMDRAPYHTKKATNVPHTDLLDSDNVDQSAHGPNTESNQLWSVYRMMKDVESKYSHEFKMWTKSIRKDTYIEHILSENISLDDFKNKCIGLPPVYSEKISSLQTIDRASIQQLTIPVLKHVSQKINEDKPDRLFIYELLSYIRRLVRGYLDSDGFQDVEIPEIVILFTPPKHYTFNLPIELSWSYMKVNTKSWKLDNKRDRLAYMASLSTLLADVARSSKNTFASSYRRVQEVVRADYESGRIDDEYTRSEVKKRLDSPLCKVD